MLIVEGIMAIQAGVSPRVVEELLKSHVPPTRARRSRGAGRGGRGAGEAEAA